MQSIKPSDILNDVDMCCAGGSTDCCKEKERECVIV